MEYDGPNELANYARFFPRIGELIMSFSVVETWMMQAIMISCRLDQVETEKLERKRRAFEARIKYLRENGAELANLTNTKDNLDDMCARLADANEYRNLVAHHMVCGLSSASERSVAIRKRKYGSDSDDVYIFLEELKHKVGENIRLRDDLRDWCVVCEEYRRAAGEEFSGSTSRTNVNLFLELARSKGYL